jgi:hypothetical protein
LPGRAERADRVLEVVDQPQHEHHVEVPVAAGVHLLRVGLLELEARGIDPDVVAHQPGAPDVELADVEAHDLLRAPLERELAEPSLVAAEVQDARVRAGLCERLADDGLDHRPPRAMDGGEVALLGRPDRAVADLPAVHPLDRRAELLGQFARRLFGRGRGGPPAPQHLSQLHALQRSQPA